MTTQWAPPDLTGSWGLVGTQAAAWLAHEDPDGHGWALLVTGPRSVVDKMLRIPPETGSVTCLLCGGLLTLDEGPGIAVHDHPAGQFVWARRRSDYQGRPAVVRLGGPPGHETCTPAGPCAARVVVEPPLLSRFAARMGWLCGVELVLVWLMTLAGWLGFAHYSLTVSVLCSLLIVAGNGMAIAGTASRMVDK